MNCRNCERLEGERDQWRGAAADWKDCAETWKAKADRYLTQLVERGQQLTAIRRGQHEREVAAAPSAACECAALRWERDEYQRLWRFEQDARGTDSANLAVAREGVARMTQEYTAAMRMLESCRSDFASLASRHQLAEADYHRQLDLAAALVASERAATERMAGEVTRMQGERARWRKATPPTARRSGRWYVPSLAGSIAAGLGVWAGAMGYALLTGCKL